MRECEPMMSNPQQPYHPWQHAYQPLPAQNYANPAVVPAPVDASQYANPPMVNIILPTNQVPVFYAVPGARPFAFDGGAGSYLLVGIGAALLTICTLGVGMPWALSMRYRWQCEHTMIYGHRLRFTGSGADLFGNYVKCGLRRRAILQP